MLQPTNLWQWQYAESGDELRLDLDATMAFSTAYRKKHLTQEIFRDSQFSVEDAHFYQLICMQFQSLNLYSDAQIVQIALNATAVKRFFKPTMPKSWYFKENQLMNFNQGHIGGYGGAGNQVSLGVGKSCLLYTEDNVGQFLLVECGDSASLCMLLDESLALNESKSLNQFEIIKVMNDRLFESVEVAALKYA